MANALLDSLAPAWAATSAPDLPAWWRERQRRALQAAQEATWPDRGAERWKYTSLHALSQRAPETLVTSAAPTQWDRPGLRYVDGALAAIGATEPASGIELASLSSLIDADDERLRFAIGREAEGRDVFDHINTAFAADGAWLRAPADVELQDWLHLTMASGAAEDDRAWHLTHRIELASGARLRLLVEVEGGEAKRFATAQTRIRIHRGAQLDLAWCASPAAALSLIARTRIELEAGARLRLHLLDGGAAPSRHELTIALRGEHAHSELGGVFLLGDRRHADVQLDLRHEHADTSSETTWRAIAGDRARAVFDGHITVAVGADGTDAQLGCKSLLTSTQAEVDAKPVLEIYADDVKCAHGATVGQLDAQALFYLRARGLPEAQARSLLMSAFCQEAFGDAGAVASPAAERLRTWLATSS